MGSALALLALAGVWIWRRLSRRTGGVAPGAARSGHWLAALKDMPRQCLEFVRFHPGRFAASVCFFMAGYAWCILEAWWTCLFIGTPVALATAAGIEILSNLANGVFFMVPAKVGTMEAGAAAIFAGFGLSAGAGFAFGVIRHVRELAWAGAGLLLCPLDWRRTARKPSEQNP
jgi:uncharacterized membrane protein YbhN (UPF0104 family)